MGQLLLFGPNTFITGFVVGFAVAFVVLLQKPSFYGLFAVILQEFRSYIFRKKPIGKSIPNYRRNCLYEESFSL